MKRKAALLLAASLTAAALCGTAALASDAERPTITFSFWTSKEDTAPFTKLIYDKVDEINADETKPYKVEVIYVSTDQCWAKYAALSAAGTMYDVMQFSPNQRCFDYVDAGSLYNLSEALDSEWGKSFVEGAFSSVSYQDGIWAIPLYKSSACVFYNKDLFEQAGITETPKTWDEFLTVCETLKNAGIQPIAMSCKDPDTWCTAMFTAYLVQRLGGIDPVYAISNREEGYTFVQDCFIKAGEMTKELLDLGYIQPTAIADSNDQATALVKSGQAAILCQGSWAISSLNADDSAVAGNMGVFAFPTIEGGEGGNMWMSKYAVYAVGSNTQYPEYCVDFLQELTSPEMEAAYAEQAGQIPAVGGLEVNADVCPSELRDVMELLETSEGDFPFFDELFGTTVGNEWNSTLGSICAGTKTSEKAFTDLQNYTELNN